MPIKEGLVMKRSIGRSKHTRVNWKQRYFVLTADRLRYYPTKDAIKESGSIEMSTVLVVERVDLEAFNGRSHVIQLGFAEGGRMLTLYAQCPSRAEADDWLWCLRSLYPPDSVRRKRLNARFCPGVQASGGGWTCCESEHQYGCCLPWFLAGDGADADKESLESTTPEPPKVEPFVYEPIGTVSDAETKVTGKGAEGGSDDADLSGRKSAKDGKDNAKYSDYEEVGNVKTTAHADNQVSVDEYANGKEFTQATEGNRVQSYRLDYGDDDPIIGTKNEANDTVRQHRVPTYEEIDTTQAKIYRKPYELPLDLDEDKSDVTTPKPVIQRISQYEEPVLLKEQVGEAIVPTFDAKAFSSEETTVYVNCISLSEIKGDDDGAAPDWWAGCSSPEECAAAIANGSNGDFLLRESQAGEPGLVVLGVYDDGAVINFSIERESDLFVMPGIGRGKTLADLVAYLREESLPSESDNSRIILRNAVSVGVNQQTMESVSPNAPVPSFEAEHNTIIRPVHTYENLPSEEVPEFKAAEKPDQSKLSAYENWSVIQDAMATVAAKDTLQPTAEADT